MIANLLLAHRWINKGTIFCAAYNANKDVPVKEYTTHTSKAYWQNLTWGKNFSSFRSIYDLKIDEED